MQLSSWVPGLTLWYRGWPLPVITLSQPWDLLHCAGWLCVPVWGRLHRTGLWGEGAHCTGSCFFQYLSSFRLILMSVRITSVRTMPPVMTWLLLTMMLPALCLITVSVKMVSKVRLRNSNLPTKITTFQVNIVRRISMIVKTMDVKMVDNA